MKQNGNRRADAGSEIGTGYTAVTHTGVFKKKGNPWRLPTLLTHVGLFQGIRFMGELFHSYCGHQVLRTLVYLIL